jgi:hypothetical protein
VFETEHPQGEVTIAMVGKYVDLSDSYKSVNEALRHAGMKNHVRVKIEHVDSETITDETVARLAKFDAILVPGGFGKRGIEGKIATARFARENKVPYLGICLGMQVATIEFARHVAGLADANSTEFEPGCPHPVIALITEWKDADGSIQTRDASSDLGGTMRLGAQSSDVAPARWRTDLRRRGDRAPPPPLRSQRELPGPAAQGRPGDLGADAARAPDRNRRAAAERAPLVHRRAVPPRVQVHALGRPPAVQRLHQGGAGPPGRRQESSRPWPDDGKSPHEAVWIRRRPAAPVLPDRRPLRHRVRAAADGRGRQLKEITAALGIPFIFKSSFDKANRSSGTSFPGPAWTRAWRSWPRCKASSACRC